MKHSDNPTTTEKKRGFMHAVKTAFKSLVELNRASHSYAYRVVNIMQDDKKSYQAIIQVAGKSTTFQMQPEKILADDAMTNQFSPCDVRTLTYLGYLGINSPKYKILAKKLSEDNDKMIFAVHEKGSNKVETKTADQITADNEILESLDQKDAHMVGYTVATEQTLSEEKQKLAAVAEMKKLKQKKSKE